MTEFLTRHGESEANVQGFFAGQRDDSPLTDNGREQARDAATRLEPLGITKIISSPLRRAKETAEIISDVLGGLVVQVDDRLTEYDMGELSGTLIRLVPSEELRNTPEAEDAEAFRDRVFAALFEHAHDEGNTLFVAHGGTIKIYEVTLMDKEPMEFYDLRLPGNSEIIEVDTALLKEKVGANQ